MPSTAMREPKADKHTMRVGVYSHTGQNVELDCNPEVFDVFDARWYLGEMTVPQHLIQKDTI